MLIRHALPADADAFAALAERLWRSTYTDLIPAPDLEAHLAEAFGPVQQATELADGARRTLLLEGGGVLLGYALLPIVSLAAVNVLLDLKGAAGAVLGATAVVWSTTAATRIFESAMQMTAQRWLIAYPIFLLYFCFALFTIF